MEAKHTPGPWEYGGQYGHNRGYVRAGLKTTGEPLGIKRVAVVAQDAAMAGGDPWANGCLIAAAPDLLAALEAMLQAIRPADQELWTHVAPAREQAEAAIKKAKGA